MVQIEWSDSAKLDLKEIHLFISKDSKKFAELEIKKILRRIDLLSEFPKSGKVCLDFESENTREIISGNYRIIYEITSSSNLYILFIHHGSSLLKNRN